MKAWITFILAHWWSHHLMVFHQKMTAILGGWTYLEEISCIPVPNCWHMKWEELCSSTHLPSFALPYHDSEIEEPSYQEKNLRNGVKWAFSLLGWFFFQAFFPHSNEKLASTGWTSFMLLYSGHFHETNEFGLSPVFVSIIMINMYCLAKFACSTFSERSSVKI